MCIRDRALDLSFWSWTSCPASFLILHCDCFWTCACGHWICRSSIGRIVLKLGHRPSFILNIELSVSLNLYIVLTKRVSVQHLTCHSKAFSCRSHYECFWICMLGHQKCHSSIGLLSLVTSAVPGFVMLNIVSGLACWDIEVVTAALHLSFWNRACGPD